MSPPIVKVIIIEIAKAPTLDAKYPVIPISKFLIKMIFNKQIANVWITLNSAKSLFWFSAFKQLFPISK